MSLLPPRLRRVLTVSAVTLIFAVLAGATYQGVATAIDRREFPHPGRLLVIGDHQLHLYCTGDGSPLVILEAPASGMSASWDGVQSALAETTRVCSYDRAGLGWSESGDRAYDPGRVPDELHALLQRSAEKRPYILVGHGLGAAFARIYASRHPDDAAALVLVDAPVPDLRADPSQRLVEASPWLARAGVLRATRMLSSKADAMPGPAGGAMRGFLNRPDHLARTARELSVWDATVALAAAAPIAPGLPVISVAGGGTDRLSLLTRGEDVTRVVRAIEAVVAAARAAPAPVPR